MVLSARGGIVEDNSIRGIGVQGAEANDNNAYGVAISNQFAGEPASTDVMVQRNNVEDVPTWHALDTHGGRRISFVDNTISGASRALFITAGVNGERPTGIRISANRMVAPTDPTLNDWAVTTFNGVDVIVTGNRAMGWPDGQFFNDYKGLSTDLTILDNVVTP